MLVVIGTDCIDSRKSDYHATTTTTAPSWGRVAVTQSCFLMEQNLWILGFSSPVIVLRMAFDILIDMIIYHNI